MKKIIALLILNILIIYIVCAKSPAEVETPIVLEPDEFIRSGMFAISELNINTSDRLQAVDENYIYVSTTSFDDTEGVMIIESRYRIPRDNREAKELVANYSVKHYSEAGTFYNGDFYYCNTEYTMEQRSITLLKYGVSEPEQPEVIYEASIAQYLAFESCGQYIVMAYITREETSESEGTETTHIICYDLETENWTEVMQCESTYKDKQDGIRYYTGEMVRKVGVSEGYITWVQLTVDDEPYQSDAGTACIYQYSIQDGNKERLFASSGDALYVWGSEGVIILTARVDHSDLLENAGKLYLKIEGKWYEHAIPGISAAAGMGTHEVHEVGENIYLRRLFRN